MQGGGTLTVEPGAKGVPTWDSWEGARAGAAGVGCHERRRSCARRGAPPEGSASAPVVACISSQQLRRIRASASECACSQVGAAVSVVAPTARSNSAAACLCALPLAARGGDQAWRHVGVRLGTGASVVPEVAGHAQFRAGGPTRPVLARDGSGHSSSDAASSRSLGTTPKASECCMWLARSGLGPPTRSGLRAKPAPETQLGRGPGP
jgi:hypothetical protein